MTQKSEVVYIRTGCAHTPVHKRTKVVHLSRECESLSFAFTW